VDKCQTIRCSIAYREPTLQAVTVIEVVNEAFTPASEPRTTNTTEVQDAIRGLKVGKEPGPNDIPNRPL